VWWVGLVPRVETLGYFRSPLKGWGRVGLNVRSAWYIDVVGGAPRFVTVHPLPKS